ncbi:hypothetical protein DMENIID0001_136110 [Sergentomyia squamirostris]
MPIYLKKILQSMDYATILGISLLKFPQAVTNIENFVRDTKLAWYDELQVKVPLPPQENFKLSEGIKSQLEYVANELASNRDKYLKEFHEGTSTGSPGLQKKTLANGGLCPQMSSIGRHMDSCKRANSTSKQASQSKIQKISEYYKNVTSPSGSSTPMTGDVHEELLSSSDDNSQAQCDIPNEDIVSSNSESELRETSQGEIIGWGDSGIDPFVSTSKTSTYKAVSRSHRRQRQLLSIVDTTQRTLPEFGFKIEKLNDALTQCEDWNKTMSFMDHRHQNPSPIVGPSTSSSVLINQNSITHTNTSKFTQVLMDLSASRAKRLNYPDHFKLFCTYLFMISGRKAYRTLQANLKIPALSTTTKVMREEALPPIEGELRIEELKQFLETRGLSKTVWLSEDATRITGKVQYDASTDTIVGLITPLVSYTGLPQKCHFSAASLQDILRAFENEPSKYVNVIMVRPMDAAGIGFCLTVHSVGESTVDDIEAKWRTIRDSLKLVEIEVLGVSTDGDLKYLRTMRMLMNLPMLSENGMFDWFHGKLDSLIHYVQDSVHIGAKLKTRLLNTDNKLQLGSTVIDPKILQILVETVPKDQHFLNSSDLNSKDKMNFSSVEKLISSNVRNSLVKMNGISRLSIEALCLYLELMENSITPFISLSMEPKMRLYKLWKSIFILRTWRNFVLRNKNLSCHNFITSNANLCIEINGHSLVNLMRHLREYEKPHEFLPHLCSSQVCEGFFRNLRSMSTTNNTVVNFSFLEVTHRIRRIDLMEEIKNKVQPHGYKIPTDSKTFRDDESTKKPLICTSLPSDAEINEIVLTAKTDALSEMKKFIRKPDASMSVKKINYDFLAPDCHEFNEEPEIDHFDVEDYFQNHLEEFCEEDGSDEENQIEGLNIEVNLRDYKSAPVEKDSRFLNIRDKKGKEMVVRKSSLCWLLSNETNKVSNDRLRRFKEPAAHERTKVKIKKNV